MTRTRAASLLAALLTGAIGLGTFLWLTRGGGCDGQRRRRELALQEALFAIRRALDDAYAAEHRRPRRLEELVPKYLQRVPVDPMTGTADWRLERDGDGIVDVATPARGATCAGIPYDEL
jgi:hypothetical protein